MLRTVPMFNIRGFSRYTQKWYMSYRFCWQLASRIKMEPAKPVWHVSFLCIEWKTTDGGHWNWPKYGEFYSKNKFGKLVYLVGFIIRIYHDARSSECQTQQVSLYIKNTSLMRIGGVNINRTFQIFSVCWQLT